MDHLSPSSKTKMGKESQNTQVWWSSFRSRPEHTQWPPICSPDASNTRPLPQGEGRAAKYRQACQVAPKQDMLRAGRHATRPQSWHFRGGSRCVAGRLQTELKANLGYAKVPKRSQRTRVVRQRRTLIGSQRRPIWPLLSPDQGRWVPGSRGVTFEFHAS